MSVGEMVLDDFVSWVEIENILPQNFAVGAANSETQGGFTLSLLSEINSHQNQINARALQQFLSNHFTEGQKIDYFG